MQYLHLRLHSASAKAHNEKCLLLPWRIGVPTLLSAGPALTRLLSLLPFKGEEAFALIFIIIFFFLQLKGFEGKSDASLSQLGRLPIGAGSARSLVRLPWREAKHFGRAGPPAGQHCPRKPLCNSQLNCFQKPDVFKGKEGRKCARGWKGGLGGKAASGRPWPGGGLCHCKRSSHLWGLAGRGWKPVTLMERGACPGRSWWPEGAGSLRLDLCCCSESFFWAFLF